MGPELLNPQRFCLKDSRPTRHSDCYALGMVVYEVLSERIPFYQDADLVVVGQVVEGKRPVRPQGVEGLWFMDDVWGVLERCWKSQPDSRPSIKDVLQFLEGVSRSWTPPPPWAVAGVSTMNLPTRCYSESSIDGTAESGVPSPSRVGPSQPSSDLQSKGALDKSSVCPPTDKFSALYEAPVRQDLGVNVNSKRSDLERPVGVPDMVGGTVSLGDSWY